MRLGEPDDPDTKIGPLASEEQFDKVRGYLDLAPKEGASIVTGGIDRGWYVRPTVLVDVAPSMRVCREEIFGPVVTVQAFDTEEEAIHLANDTPYGLKRDALHREPPKGPPCGRGVARGDGVGELLLRA